MTGAPAGRSTIPLVHDGRDRPFLLHVPPAASGGHPPLVLQLHGRGIDPVMFDRWTGFSALADEAGFVLAMPAAVDEVWNDGRYRGTAWDATDDVGYLLAVVDDVAARLSIDPGRIYVVGMSNGAAMAGRLACEHGDRFAAVAQVAGTVGEEIAAACHPTLPVPILEIHGTKDRFAPYGGGSARGLRARLMLCLGPGTVRPSVGVDAWARLWVDANGAHDGPRTEALPPDTTVRRWTGASPASDVVFYRVEGGGHTWPGNRMWVPPLFGRTGQAIDATRVAWEFLAGHSRGA